MKLKAELRFVLITSSAKALPLEAREPTAEETELPGLWVKVMVSQYEKCVRCWQRRPDVNQDHAHPGICGRCVENIAAPGETRQFA
jgi:isoleucyl-tRNA synthetase